MPCHYIAVIVAAGLSAGRACGGSEPTDFEQYSLELINRARRDLYTEAWRLRDQTWGDDPKKVPGSSYPQPQRPSPLEGLPVGALSSTSVQPLAFNVNLVQAARAYANTLLEKNAFSHYYGGTYPQSRAYGAGYVSTSMYGVGENLAVTTAPGVHVVDPGVVARHHAGLFVDASVPGRVDRVNLVSPDWKEVGIGFEERGGYSYFGAPANAVLSAYSFSRSAAPELSKPMLTGVVFSDGVVDNEFYDPGEGFGGVTVSATSRGVTTTTTTFASGGYSLPLTYGIYYEVTFSGGALPNPVTFRNISLRANVNLKLDVSADQGVWDLDGNGSWHAAANWSGRVPDGAGQVATLGRSAGVGRTIAVAAPVTLGALVLDQGIGYTVSASGSGQFVMDAGDVAARVESRVGSHAVNAPLHLRDPLEVYAAAGTTLVLAGVVTESGPGKPLTKLSQGELRLAGDNAAFGSGVNILDGYVRAGHSNALGSGPVTLGFGANNVSLSLDTAGVDVRNSIEVSAGDGQRGIGASHASGVSTFSGPITLGRHVSFDVTGAAATLNLTGGVGSIVGVNAYKRGAGTLFLGGGVNSFTGSFLVDEGTLVLAGTVASGSVLVRGDAAVRFAADQTLTSLSVQRDQPGDQAVDLSGHWLHVVASNLAAREQAIRTMIARSGRDGLHDSTSTGSTAVGYAVTGGYLLARKALVGDANLDDRVDFDDLVALAQNYNTTTGMVWRTGDFTYDGVTDFADLVALAQNYGTALAGASVPGAADDFRHDLPVALASVPEPTGLALVLCAGCGLGCGRRARRRVQSRSAHACAR